MKNRTIFLITAVLCLAISCSKETETERPFIGCGGGLEYFTLSNRSEHTIAIASKSEYPENFPDSLVLQHGEQFDFDEYLVLDIFSKRTVYYDARYAITTDDIPLEHNPGCTESYEYISPRHSIFTFTEEDYLYAVEHGTDLKAGE